MTGYEVYKMYIALKNHFNTKSYDFIKYKGKTNVSYKKYCERNDKKLFEKLANKYPTKTIFKLFIANFITINNIYITDLTLDGETFSNFLEWKQRIGNLTENFIKDLHLIKEKMKTEKMFIVKDKEQMAYIFKMVIRKEINIETFAILSKILQLSKKIKTNNTLVKKILLKGEKYEIFLKYDEEKFRKLVIKILKSNI